jgi:hypothetical protein
VRLLHAARVRRMPTTCHIASFIDTLPLTNQRGLRSVGNLRLAIQTFTKVFLAIQTSKGFDKWHEVATGGIHVALGFRVFKP